MRVTQGPVGPQGSTKGQKNILGTSSPGSGAGTRGLQGKERHVQRGFSGSSPARDGDAASPLSQKTSY